MIKKIKAPILLRGTISPPGDKSISHRAVIFNSIARGNSTIENFSPGDDCLATVDCMKTLGVNIESVEQNMTLHISGAGNNGLTKPNQELNAKNSGTTMRLLTGLLAAQDFPSTITGDASLCSRPMDRIIKPLNLMGAEIISQGAGSGAPLIIHGKKLHGITYHLPMASAQVKSALILAALFAENQTTLSEPVRSRDHTELLLKTMGAELINKESSITISPLQLPLSSLDICIPGDISSAAYWLVAGALHPDAQLELLNIGVNPTRTGIIDVLLEMGANLEIKNRRTQGGEPVADISIKSSKLKGTTICGPIIPRLIDEIPVLAVAAALADGITTIKDAAELRVKESDRINTTAQQLAKFGAIIENLPDGMIIQGIKSFSGTECDSMGDHRLAMSLGIAALLARGETTINNSEAVNISYPAFWQHAKKISLW